MRIIIVSHLCNVNVIYLPFCGSAHSIPVSEFFMVCGSDSAVLVTTTQWPCSCFNVLKISRIT